MLGHDPDATAAANPTRGSVLVVEDNSSVLQAMASILTDEGYHAAEATGPVQALTILQGFAGPLVVLIDVNLQCEGDGLVLAAMVRSLRPDVPVVYASGERHDGFGPGRLVDGHFFLEKPFAVDDLLTVVAEAFRARRERQEPTRGVAQVPGRGAETARPAPSLYSPRVPDAVASR